VGGCSFDLIFHDHSILRLGNGQLNSCEVGIVFWVQNNEKTKIHKSNSFVLSYIL